MSPLRSLIIGFLIGVVRSVMPAISFDLNFGLLNLPGNKLLLVLPKTEIPPEVTAVTTATLTNVEKTF